MDLHLGRIFAETEGNETRVTGSSKALPTIAAKLIFAMLRSGICQLIGYFLILPNSHLSIISDSRAQLYHPP